MRIGADRVLVIAEAGVNHNGDIDMAHRLIEAAAKTGADVVKFQTYKTDKVVTGAARKAAYQQARTGDDESQSDMLRKLELSFDAFRELADACRASGIEFLSTPFDLDSLRFLACDLALPTLKMGSGELTNALFLLEAARLGCDVILSTGMGTSDEVAEALGALAFGYTCGTAAPSRKGFAEALRSPEGEAAVRDRVVLLHCTSDYPAPVNEANLRAIDTLRETFGTTVGFSDHTEGIVVALAAVARGARVVEKHLTLDRNLPGPDHRASLEPDDFAAMVAGIRTVEMALGTGVKDVQPSELDARMVARRSLAATAPIAKGERYSEGNLSVLRPGTGISPMHYWEWLGRPADRAYAAGELIEE